MLETKPDIISVMEAEGIELKRGKAKCPFHDEDTASFSIKDQFYHCFGCGAHGDVVDFIQNRHGLSFSEALVYLGIKRGERPKPDPVAERKRALRKAYELWKHNYYISLCDEAIEINFLKGRIGRLPESFAWFLAEQLAKLDKINYCLDVMQSKDEKQIHELFKVVINGRRN